MPDVQASIDVHMVWVRKLSCEIWFLALKIKEMVIWWLYGNIYFMIGLDKNSEFSIVLKWVSGGICWFSVTLDMYYELLLHNCKAAIWGLGATLGIYFALLNGRDGRLKVIGGDNIEGFLVSPKRVPCKHLEVGIWNWYGWIHVAKFVVWFEQP